MEKFKESILKDGTKVVWRVISTVPTDGFEKSFIDLGTKPKNPYDVQNKLHSTFNYPKYLYLNSNADLKNINSDEYSSVYVDRLATDISNYIEGIINKGMLSKEDFQRIANIVFPKTISGARCVRFTNVSNGYPSYRMDFVVKGKDTPKWEELDIFENIKEIENEL